SAGNSISGNHSSIGGLKGDDASHRGVPKGRALRGCLCGDPGRRALLLLQSCDTALRPSLMVAFLLKGVRPSLTSFVVAVLAVGLAWLWLKISVVASLVFVVAGAALGFGAFGAGRRLLRSERPKPERAVSYLDWTVMAPGAVAAAVGAVLIVVAIDIAPGDHASSETKALLGAIGAAVSTYLTTVFIKGAEE